VLASADHVLVGPDLPAELMVRVELAQGFHTNDAYAGTASAGTLVPLRIGVAGGTGVRVYAEYPRGQPVSGAAHATHEGSVDIPIALELDGTWTGTPRLVVTLQVCDHHRCLAPMAVDLDVQIERES